MQYILECSHFTPNVKTSKPLNKAKENIYCLSSSTLKQKYAPFTLSSYRRSVRLDR